MQGFGQGQTEIPIVGSGGLPLYLKGFAGTAGVDQAFSEAAPNTRGRVII